MFVQLQFTSRLHFCTLDNRIQFQLQKRNHEKIREATECNKF